MRNLPGRYPIGRSRWNFPHDSPAPPALTVLLTVAGGGRLYCVFRFLPPLYARRKDFLFPRRGSGRKGPVRADARRGLFASPGRCVTGLSGRAPGSAGAGAGGVFYVTKTMHGAAARVKNARRRFLQAGDGGNVKGGNGHGQARAALRAVRRKAGGRGVFTSPVRCVTGLSGRTPGSAGGRGVFKSFLPAPDTGLKRHIRVLTRGPRVWYLFTGIFVFPFSGAFRQKAPGTRGFLPRSARVCRFCSGRW